MRGAAVALVAALWAGAALAEPFGVLDLGDIGAFTFSFLNQDPIADIDHNGIYDLTDINQFINAFVNGCP